MKNHQNMPEEAARQGRPDRRDAPTVDLHESSPQGSPLENGYRKSTGAKNRLSNIDKINTVAGLWGFGAESLWDSARIIPQDLGSIPDGMGHECPLPEISQPRSGQECPRSNSPVAFSDESKTRAPQKLNFLSFARNILILF